MNASTTSPSTTSKRAHRPRTAAAPLALLLGIALACTSCSDDLERRDTPSVTIVEPADGAVVDATSPFRVEVRNFQVVDNPGGSNTPGQGHFHVFIDGVYVQPPVSDRLEFRINELVPSSPLEPGNHEIEVRLVNNDHTFLEPPISDSVVITIAE